MVDGTVGSGGTSSRLPLVIKNTITNLQCTIHFVHIEVILYIKYITVFHVTSLLFTYPQTNSVIAKKGLYSAGIN